MKSGVAPNWELHQKGGRRESFLNPKFICGFDLLTEYTKSSWNFPIPRQAIGLRNYNEICSEHEKSAKIIGNKKNDDIFMVCKQISLDLPSFK